MLMSPPKCYTIAEIIYIIHTFFFQATFLPPERFFGQIHSPGRGDLPGRRIVALILEL